MFEVADETMDKCDQLIDRLEQQLVQRTATETVFAIGWAAV